MGARRHTSVIAERALLVMGGLVFRFSLQIYFVCHILIRQCHNISSLIKSKAAKDFCAGAWQTVKLSKYFPFYSFITIQIKM